MDIKYNPLNEYYFDILNNIHLKVQNFDTETNVYKITVDKETQIKLLKLFGLTTSEEILLKLFKELKEMGLTEILNKYLYSFADIETEININRDLYQFMIIHRYEIKNKLGLIMAQYRKNNVYK